MSDSHVKLDNTTSVQSSLNQFEMSQPSELLESIIDQLRQKFRDKCEVKYTITIKQTFDRPTDRNKNPTNQDEQGEVKLGKQSNHSPFIKCHHCYRLGHIKRICPDLVRL